ncbi:OmpA family protein [Alcaligenaceae bacterium CGII-47]|nr:OmpA family protein [Alcaligenaceae bacterium CGII-47]
MTLTTTKRSFMAIIGLTVAIVLAGCATANKKHQGFVLDSDVAFKFGSAELTPAAKKMIDEYAAMIDRRTDIRVDVVGHTDRIGNDRANVALAERRALAVRSQLLLSRLEPGRVFSRSVGAAEPLVQCNQANHKALIACLSPNRRVEVYVNTRGF